MCVSLPVLSLDGQLLGFLLGQQPAGRWQLLFQLLHSGRVPLHTQTTNRWGSEESWGDKSTFGCTFSEKVGNENKCLTSNLYILFPFFFFFYRNPTCLFISEFKLLPHYLKRASEQLLCSFFKLIIVIQANVWMCMCCIVLPLEEITGSWGSTEINWSSMMSWFI